MLALFPRYKTIRFFCKSLYFGNTNICHICHCLWNSQKCVWPWPWSLEWAKVTVCEIITFELPNGFDFNVWPWKWRSKMLTTIWMKLAGEGTLLTYMGGVDGDVCHQHIGGYLTWRWRLLSDEITSENSIASKTESRCTPVATAVVPDLSPPIL